VRSFRLWLDEHLAGLTGSIESQTPATTSTSATDERTTSID